MNYSPPRIIAATWALVCCALHLLWASGSVLGRPAPGWSAVYDLAAAAVSLIAMVIALLGGRKLLFTVAGLAFVGAGLVVVFTNQAGWIGAFFAVGAIAFVLAALHRFRDRIRLHRNENVALDR